MHRILGVTLILSIFLLSGCGQTNYLKWATTDKQSDIELARTYLDEGKYDKALAIVDGDNSSEARIIYAECLMGKNDIATIQITKALSDNSLTDNPVIRLETILNTPAKRAAIKEAAQIFIDNVPNKSSDKLIGAICNMTAHVANIKDAFDRGATAGMPLGNLENYYITTYPGTDIVTGLPNYQIINNVTVNYTALGTNPVYYMSGAVLLLGSLTEQADIKGAIVSMNAEIVSINRFIKSPTQNPTGQVPWFFVRTLLGY